MVDDKRSWKFCWHNGGTLMAGSQVLSGVALCAVGPSYNTGIPTEIMNLHRFTAILAARVAVETLMELKITF